MPYIAREWVLLSVIECIRWVSYAFSALVGGGPPGLVDLAPGMGKQVPDSENPTRGSQEYRPRVAEQMLEASDCRTRTKVRAVD